MGQTTFNFFAPKLFLKYFSLVLDDSMICSFSFSLNTNHEKAFLDLKRWDKELLRTPKHVEIYQDGL